MIIGINSIIITSISSKENFIFDKFKITVPQNITPEQFGEFLSGFIDGEGYFSVYINKNNHIEFRFKIEIHIDDCNILYKIKKYFGVGYINIRKTRPICVYTIVGSKSCMNSVVPLLNKYPLKTNKYHDYKNFCIIMTICENIKSSRLEGDILNKIIIIKNQINSSNFSASPMDVTISKYWLLGFIEAEGTFGLKNFVSYFSVGQRKENKYLLDIIADYLYKITDTKYKFKISNTLNKRTSVIVISIQSIDALFEINISLLITIPFQSRKKVDFIY